MNKKLFLAWGLLAACTAHAQLAVESNGVLYVGSSDTLSVSGDIVSSADILGAGTVVLNGRTLQHINMNGFALPALLQDNPGNTWLEGDAHIAKDLHFNSGKIRLNGFSLVLEAAAGLSGYDNNRYFITDGGDGGQEGQLVRRSLGNAAFTFPVGGDDSRYNPLTITQYGPVHDLGVRALTDVLSKGSSGIPLDKDAVNASWQVSNHSPGADDLSLVAAWNGQDELPGFDRGRAFLSAYDGGTWDKPQATAGVQMGAGTYSCGRTHVTRTGLFSVGLSVSDAPESVNKITVFPNPVNTGFYVSLPVSAGVIRLNLLDLKGKFVRTRVIGPGVTGNYYFDLGQGGPLLAQGTYMLQVVGSKGILATKEILLMGQ